MQDDKGAYDRIRRDLNCLVGTTIEARNAFWDNEKKAYVDATFHLFERVYFYRREGSNRQQVLPLAYIEASKELWGSVEASGLITLKHVDSEFFRSLTPLQQRLALYLGKMMYAATEHRRDALQLGRQLPVLAQNYKDVKKQLTKACEGLLEREFPYLTAYHYERKRDGKGENIIFHRKGAKDHGEVRPRGPREQEQEEQKFERVRRNLLVQDIVEVTGIVDGKRSRAFYELVTQKLTEETIRRALSETKDADRQNEIRTTRARYFTDTIKRFAAEQGIILNPRKREGGERSDWLRLEGIKNLGWPFTLGRVSSVVRRPRGEGAT